MTLPSADAQLHREGLWRRERFHVVLVGPQAEVHRDLIRRAGYQVRTAANGNDAQHALEASRPLDVVVIDFALSDRPPEALVLFAAQANAGAPLVAVVSARDSDAYRRAFHAGARDVLPAPARGEDLLAAIDGVLEPHALAEALERMRALLEPLRGQAPAHAPVPPPSAELPRVELELKAAALELERLRARLTAAETQRAEEAIATARLRERAHAETAEAQRRILDLRAELQNRDAEIRALERTCAQLQRKQDDAQETLGTPGVKPAVASWPLGQSVSHNPERLSYDTLAHERDGLEQRVRELEQMLAMDPDPAEQGRRPQGESSDPEQLLHRRAEDEARLQELDRLLVQHQALQHALAQMERELDDKAAQSRRIVELEELLAERGQEVATAAKPEPGAPTREAQNPNTHPPEHTESLALLDAVRMEQDAPAGQLQEARRKPAAPDAQGDHGASSPSPLDALRAELSRVRAESEERGLALDALTRDHARRGDELDARSRALLRAQAQSSALARRVEELRDELTGLRAEKESLAQRFRLVEAELEGMRLHVAALVSARQH